MSAAEQGPPAPETRFPVKFIVASRQVMAVPRVLQKISFSLEELADGSVPDLPALSDKFDGYRIFSAPQDSVATIRAMAPGYVLGGRHDYPRHFIDMSDGYEAYMNHFSAKTRSTLRRKQRKLSREGELEDNGSVDIREFRSPVEIAEFMDLALPLSQRTYQARSLDAGLPDDKISRNEMLEMAAQNNLRCYLLYFRGAPISYLFLPVVKQTVIYAYLGYDEEYRRLSPGTVLQMYALERLFAENRYRYFDFTEGDGPHKAMFGNRSIAACSFFLLKATPSNRLLLAALDMFDAGVAATKKLLTMTGAQPKIRQAIRRA